MIKEFVQYLLQLGNTRQEEVGTQIYTTQPMHLVKQPTPEQLVTRNLTGLVDYLKSNYDNQPPVLLHVESPTTVNVYSTYNRDMRRNLLISAQALLPDIPFSSFMDLERFNILLQSCFVVSETRDKLLAIAGNVQESNVATVGDDGIAQQVTAKTGVATMGNVVLPNPVHLKPYRTFVEITQPESRFIFRMQQGPRAALIEADGGAWKLEAIQSIKEFLATILGPEIDAGKVTIIA
ncbi:hypothetical protein PA598K_01366 [Paenibacillus sp. 598K]|uniref:hypothetical protein n=1 Tax=Paenibacillus sp. 598K TaxID=1117987 RepID=UPI000FF96CB7|nr:hypothetical protein [Paenibacillus sp. 598K]GBF73081.1 hypothetical protein PA598K_01366 [Paenibacillus sp. 598K]